MNPDHDEHRLGLFKTGLERVNLQSDTIVGLANDILRVGNQRNLLKMYLSEWDFTVKHNPDEKKVKALIYVMNEVIQQRFRDHCGDILKYVNPLLLEAFSLVAEKFPAIVPSCNRVVQILKERNSCGPDDSIYECYRRALWGFKVTLPGPEVEDEFSGKGPEVLENKNDRWVRNQGQDTSDKDQTISDLHSGFRDGTSDDELEGATKDSHILSSITRSMKASRSYIGELEVRKDARRMLDRQLQKLGASFLGSRVDKEEWVSPPLEAKRRQVTGLLIKEWEIRYNLQSEYKDLLAELQRELDVTIHRVNQISVYKNIVQMARLRLV